MLMNPPSLVARVERMPLYMVLSWPLLLSAW